MLPDLAARPEGFQPLLAQGFSVPKSWEGTYARLIPAGPEWTDLDFEAVVASRSKLKHLFGPEDDWPPGDLSRSMDEADLAWHANEFELGKSFAYHLLDTDQRECLGCLYIYPTASMGHDAEAYLWTHLNLDKKVAERIEHEIIDWLDLAWPFESIAWPGRFISFESWAAAGLKNYYRCTRTTSFPYF